MHPLSLSSRVIVTNAPDFDFNNYYKGVTINDDIKSYFQNKYKKARDFFELYTTGMSRREIERMLHRDALEALTYIRGRSLPDQFVIIDEAQNLTPHEVKTVVSRAGEDSKLILTGDAYQIDNPYLDASSNGLTYVVERFKKEPIHGHITLAKSERSLLASLAADLL